MTPSEKRQRLRAILNGNETVSPATVFDALSARVAEAAGYTCGILSGSVSATTVLGAPDMALQTLTEFAHQVRTITRASDLSVFVDADQGYGNALNVMRTVEELEHAGLAGLALYRRHARRAAQVAVCALAVSAATWIALGDDYVRFGILHCIAAAMLIGPLLVRLGRWNAVLAAVVLAAGLALMDGPESDVPGLLVLGVSHPGGAGVDWYPLAPWLAPMLLGLAVGLALYPTGRRGAWGRRLPTPRHAAAIGAPGRHALPIYLVHQPVLIALVAGVLALLGVEWSWDAFT